MKKIALIAGMLLIILNGYGQKIRQSTSISPYAEEEKKIEMAS